MEPSVARIRRSITEKRRIVELTLMPGQSVARVAQAEGVNSHQVFQWRRAYRKGELTGTGGNPAALLPVVMAAVNNDGMDDRQQLVNQEPASLSGAIHIELPGRASISVESGADATMLRAILEVLRK